MESTLTPWKIYTYNMYSWFTLGRISENHLNAYLWSYMGYIHNMGSTLLYDMSHNAINFLGLGYVTGFKFTANLVPLFWMTSTKMQTNHGPLWVLNFPKLWIIGWPHLLIPKFEYPPTNTTLGWKVLHMAHTIYYPREWLPLNKNKERKKNTVW